jgi:hypothetical protein
VLALLLSLFLTAGPGFECNWTVGIHHDDKTGWVADAKPSESGGDCTSRGMLQKEDNTYYLGILLSNSLIIIMKVPTDTLAPGYVEYQWKQDFAYYYTDKGVIKLPVQIHLVEEI